MKNKTSYKVLLVLVCIILMVLEFVTIYIIPPGSVLKEAWDPETWVIMILYVINTIATVSFMAHTIKVFLSDSYHDDLRF